MKSIKHFLGLRDWSEKENQDKKYSEWALASPTGLPELGSKVVNTALIHMQHPWIVGL